VNELERKEEEEEKEKGAAGKLFLRWLLALGESEPPDSGLFPALQCSTAHHLPVETVDELTITSHLAIELSHLLPCCGIRCFGRSGGGRGY
jgi:hypothetical protein